MSFAPYRDALPADPIAAVTHRDPYPYYADLVANKPLYRDTRLGLWVASSADAVEAALTSDACGVRPPREPVPAALAGSPAGEIFRRLVRMNDGPGHCPLNRAVAATLASVTPSVIATRTDTCAAELAAELDATHRPESITEFGLRISPRVIGGLLGVPPDRLQRTGEWIGEFVRCVFPGSTPEQVARGARAAGHLRALFRDLYERAGSDTDNGLLAGLAREGARVGRRDPEAIIANSIGLLSQAYEATAGLIGNTLLALAARPALRARFADDSALAQAVVAEVLRHDPPTHNTRRFLARDAVVAGARMRAGESILVVLAAANRDPAANPEPAHFDPSRPNRRTYTFGAGAHACPGDTFAVTIAGTAVRHLLRAGLEPGPLAPPAAYRPSANVRIPVFARQEAPQ